MIGRDEREHDNEPAEPEGEEKKGVSLYDLVTDVESGTKKVDLEQSDIMADEQPVEEVKEEEVVQEEQVEVPVEEAVEAITEAQDVETLQEEVKKKVDYKPGRGLPLREGIKISRFGSDDDTDYSTY